MELTIRMIKSVMSDKLKASGFSKNKPDSDFDSFELNIGALIESDEHTGRDFNAAKEIAKDHLSEDKNYYKNKIFAEERRKAMKKLKNNLKKSLESRLYVRSFPEALDERLGKSLPPKQSEDKPLKRGAHRTPPKGYPSERSKYAIPGEYKYPLDTEEHIRAALSYFSMPKNYSKYSPEERKSIMARIRRAAKRIKIKLSDDKEMEKALDYGVNMLIEGLEKAMYTRREGTKGNYKYFYQKKTSDKKQGQKNKKKTIDHDDATHQWNNIIDDISSKYEDEEDIDDNWDEIEKEAKVRFNKWIKDNNISVRK